MSCRRKAVRLETMWGFSSVGRAPALQAGGQEFESLNLHHLKTNRAADSPITI